ncbi:hypothetical protein DEU38_103201 [Rhodococcus sp. AG1013]|uniref:DUF7257 domain-containing protein n=1 Tax=Rhodococcus sp. AG1013 TaxID=2183996 RepID=UPI000E0A7E36|nr:hypothetical protein [Rhodococcus sp. AG1013]RDI32468.1 hypothetical protein DEU38_103201 [Rhodococcus sp. AG1013]
MPAVEPPEDPSWVPEYTPTKAYTKATVRQLQDVDPETWQNTANPDFLALGNWIFDQLTNTFLGGARTVFDAIIKWINRFIADLLDGLNGLTGGIFNLGPLADRFRGTEQKATDAADQAMTAANEAAAAAALAAANEEANIANATAIAEANLQIGTKADPESVPTDVPGWVTLNPVEDATFPRADLAPMPTIVNGDTSNASEGFHSHKHNASITWMDPVYTTALNRLDIGYINATRARIYNTLGVVIAAGPTTGLAAFRLHVFKMGRDATTKRPTGELTRLWSSDPLQGTFSASAQDVRVDMPNDIISAKGDWYAVVVHQTGSGTTRHLLGKNTASIAAMSGVHPTRLGMNRSGQSAISETLSPAQLDTSSTWIPWVCLGQTFGLVKVSFVDLFDRADASTLGSNWSVYGVGMDVRSGVAQSKRPNYGNLATRTDYIRAVYVSQLSTDTQSVSAKITGFDRSNVNIEENPRSQVALHSNADMTRYVAVGIRWGLIEIRAYSNANPGGVTKNSTTRTWSPGDVVELHATDDAGTGKTQFVAYVNGSSVLSWTDTTDETSRGAGYRRTGFETANVHRGAIFTYVHIPSVGIDEWKAKDL